MNVTIESPIDDRVGFAPDEINTAEPTRSARLKWVVVVDEALAPGRSVNAAICVAAATADGVAGILGPDGTDADGGRHPGLPWSGCTVLSATSEQLSEIRARASTALGVYVADMPAAAQETRIYDEYLAELAGATTPAIAYYAVSLVGPRNRIDKLVKKLSLL